MSKLPLEVTLLSLLTVVPTALPAARGAQEQAQPHTVTVSGRGRVGTQPNVGVITAGLVTQGATARAALSANNETLKSLMAVVRGNQVADRDVQTIQFSVQPQYGQVPNVPGRPGEPSRIVGYQVQNLVQIKVRDADKGTERMGTLLDGLVEAGANQIYGVSFQSEGAERLRETARREAMADARNKAELLAREAGLTIGPVISIRDDVGFVPFGQVAAAGPMMAAPAAVPVSVGEQEITASVQVVFELKTPR